MENERKFITKKSAIILVAVIGVASLLILIIGQFTKPKEDSGPLVVIRYYNDVLETLPLSEDKIIESDSLANSDLKLTIIIENSQVYFEKSECPDQVCVNTGKLSHIHDFAACLPAGISVIIEDSDSEEN